ncbi:hypothetical protein ACFOHK_15895 [Falsigemmobacter intermedius]|uniref:Uncharacterized protein n=1 Tax=Falsigemmobacter intermedius TaxID=1553448 RepID=A0A3S3UZE1_9RHOB|nr:hypothetical protein [Falsigemmobacter intermedius]RWY39096.1 hypothetical protein EP867_14895 [Falsigemmobacter intermedius]
MNANLNDMRLAGLGHPTIGNLLVMTVQLGQSFRKLIQRILELLKVCIEFRSVCEALPGHVIDRHRVLVTSRKIPREQKSDFMGVKFNILHDLWDLRAIDVFPLCRAGQASPRDLGLPVGRKIGNRNAPLNTLGSGAIRRIFLLLCCRPFRLSSIN